MKRTRTRRFPSTGWRRAIRTSRRSSSWSTPRSSTPWNGARSDIHIETRDQEVAIKYRIDGVLHYAMPPIAKDWHSTIISRIKVMSELDIAERRMPQDGRFRVRYKNRLIDFRVSIMPTVFGEDAVLRVLDKESMSEKFSSLSLDVVGFSGSDDHQVPALHQRAVRHGAGHRARPVRVKRRRSTRR